ncbi:MAG TPA: twin-arginine translocation signal domain-containing protein [Blastocatellia bacterium]|nr:twin-arginine translocation signal domain-containing protein [Blastocatellia bacterium]
MGRNGSDSERPRCGISRRGFLGTVGAGVIGVAASSGGQPGAKDSSQEREEVSKISLDINGRVYEVESE